MSSREITTTTQLFDLFVERLADRLADLVSEKLSQPQAVTKELYTIKEAAKYLILGL